MARHRSPNYPAIGLGPAIEKAKILFDKDKRTVVDPVVAVTHFGYKGLNGPARVTISAVKKYGLIEEVKGGIRVTDLAVRILHPADDEQRIAALREAALTPTLFRDLHQTHAEASDAAIVSALVQRGFSADAAGQALSAFRNTLTVANLTALGYTPPEKGGDAEAMTHQGQVGDDVSKLDSTRHQKNPAFVWALSKDASAELRLVGEKLTKEEADRLRQYIDLTLAALVSE